MKTKLFFLAIVLFCSCTNENKSITESDKDRVISEAKVLINTIIETCEQPDPDKLKSIYLESPDFVSLVGGVYADYDQSIVNMYSYLTTVSSQKSDIRSEKYVVLDTTTVLYTASSRWESKLKNDSIIVADPLGMQFLLKKIDNQWRVLSWTQGF
jgi:hypothetical protein